MQNKNIPHNDDRHKPSFFQKNQNNVRVVAMVSLALIVLLLLIGACLGCYFAGKNSALNNNMNDELAIANEVYTLIKKYYYKDITKEEFNKWASIGLANVMDQFSGLSYASALPSLQYGFRIKNDSYNNHIITEISHSSGANLSPAESAVGSYVDGTDGNVKLERGDILVSIDGKSVQGLTSDAMNGSEFFGKGDLLSSIELVVEKSNGKKAKFQLKKSIFATKEASYLDIDSYKQSQTGQSSNTNIGYIKLNSFTGSAATDFANCANAFKANGNTKLILDLRDNGGGSTSILSDIASYIIHDKNGKSNGLGIIRLKSEKTNETSVYSANGNNWLGFDKNDSLIPNYKLVVLVNENSASASEALLGAINYYCDEAIVIGSPTYGKGIAQQTFKLSSTSDYLLSMTVGYFEVPVANNKWQTFHGKSMMPSKDEYLIAKFSEYLDFTAKDSSIDDRDLPLYAKYYNNNILNETALIMAINALKSAWNFDKNWLIRLLIGQFVVKSILCIIILKNAWNYFVFIL